MVRLSDIPKDKLLEIEKFVQEMKGKVPVVSEGENDLVRMVKEKFGVELSPSQIYKLQKGVKTYRVSLPLHVVEKLKREYGSVGEGIKQLVKIFDHMTPNIPENLRKPYELLLSRRTVSVQEVEELLKDFGNPWDILRELSRLGLVRRVGDKFEIYKYRRDPLLEFFMSFR